MSCTPAVGQVWKDDQGTNTSVSDEVPSLENNFTLCASLRWLVEVFREDEYLGVVAAFKSEDDAKDYCLKKNGQVPAELDLFYGYAEAPCDP